MEYLRSLASESDADDDAQQSVSTGRVSKLSSNASISSLTSVDTIASRKETSLPRTNTNSMTHQQSSTNESMQSIQYANADVADISRNWIKNFGTLQSMCTVYKNADKLKFALDNAQPHSTDAYNIKIWFEKVQREAKHLTPQKLTNIKQYTDKKWLHFDFGDIDLSAIQSSMQSTPTIATKTPEPISSPASSSSYATRKDTIPTSIRSHAIIKSTVRDDFSDDYPTKHVERDARMNLQSAVRQVISSSANVVRNTNASPIQSAPIQATSNPTSAPVRERLPVVQPSSQPAVSRSTAMVGRPTTTLKKGRKPNKNTIRKQVKESNDMIWFEHFNLLLKFSDEYGHYNVPPNYVTQMDGITYKLGEWLQIQQAVLYELGECDVEKFNLLEELILNKGLWCTDVTQEDVAEQYKQTTTAGSSSSSSVAIVTGNRSPHMPRTNDSYIEQTYGDDNFLCNEEQYMDTADDTILTLAPMKRKEVESSSAHEDLNRSQKSKTVRGRTTKSKGSAVVVVAEEKTRKIRRTRSKKCTNDSDDDSVCSDDGNGLDSDPEFRFDDDDDDDDDDDSHDGNDSSDHEVHITKSTSTFKRLSQIREEKSMEISQTSSTTLKEEALAETKTFSTLGLDSIPVSESGVRSNGTSPHPSPNPAVDPQANGGLLTKHCKLGRSKANAVAASVEELNYLGFIYGIDGDKAVYFGIGLIKQQVMTQGSLTYHIELMKPRDPTNFLFSDFFLEPDEKSQIRHHHIVIHNIRFEKGTNKFEAESRRLLQSRLKTMPHLKIEGAPNGYQY